jgi:tRNA/tmRNA/rRNA uracil-C5-methylase (TrmA/RlmC/RlmD family)
MGRVEAPLRPGCVSRCPGCAHRLLDRAQSETRKQAWLTDALGAWAGRLEPLVGVAEIGRWRYRSRACLAARDGDGGWRVGLRRADEIIDIPECPVHDERLRRCLALIRARCPRAPDFPLAWYVQNRAQVTLVVKTARRPDLSWLDDALFGRIAAAGAEGLWLHLNPSTGKRIFAKRDWQLVWGHERSCDTRGLWYGPTAFQQPVDALYEHALGRAESYLAPGRDDRVVDLYCGTGASLRRWLQWGAAAIGVELSGEACECARDNAPEARVLRGSCAQRLPQIDEWLVESGTGGRRLLYANPPRTGLEREVLDWMLLRMRPERVAYLSCSAGTLGRDLQALESGGYVVSGLLPLDFFPQTYHVETLALLERD